MRLMRAAFPATAPDGAFIIPTVNVNTHQNAHENRSPLNADF